MTDERSLMERGAEGSTLESPSEFYDSIVAIWPHCRTGQEQALLSTASQRMAFSHCTAEEQGVIVTLRERTGRIPPQRF